MNGLEVVVLVRSGGCYAFFRKSKTNPFAALCFSLAPSDSLADLLPGLVREVSYARKYLVLCTGISLVDVWLDSSVQ